MIHDIKKQFDKIHKRGYYQFDWTYHGITILNFKWYPHGKGEGGFNLFYPQSYNPYSRKWKDVVQMPLEERVLLIQQCTNLWGKA